MSWDLEGKQVEGIYMGKFLYKGTVENSRVKYGGDVVHTIVLDESINVFGAVRERILVTDTENTKGVLP